MKNVNKVSFIGSGAWASALANVVAANEKEVVVYGIVKEEIDDINNNHKNSKYFGDVLLDSRIKATMDIEEAVKGSDIVVIAVPSVAMRSVMNQIKPLVTKDTIILNVAKGFEKETKMTMMEYISSMVDDNDVFGVVSLVGPSFAEEVAVHELTAIVASSKNEEAAKTVQHAFSNKWFRVYTNNDEIGTSICSSLKNVIALASGILSGLGMLVNSKAALITRGMAEITRFVTALGGKAETCLGLTGIGDLVLTCTSSTSRNFQAGFEIAKNGIEHFRETNTKTVEGIYATEIAKAIAAEKGIYAPITCAIYNVVFENKSPKEEIAKMMQNSLKSE
ncbi:MAG: NAD(P)-dependent glycerol-3-phosphate dehydrogenase [Bacilli bacterium]|nr:NAD(P)-dependent glycerol-3-phosphate dehydrogenase [Bacilli bacterium]